MSLEQRILERTRTHGTVVVTAVFSRFDETTARVWELFHTGDINVAANLFKADDRRRVIVAFRKEVAPA